MREAYDVSTERLHIIHNGVDFKRFTSPEPDPEKLRRLRATIAAPQEKIIIFAGRLTPQKGIAAIFDAANHVIKEYPNVCYILAGEPDSRNSSHSFETLTARHAELKKKFRRLGKVPRNQLAMLYRAADIALIPSIYEPFGYAALEAMASGVPVIATDAGGLAEIITHRETGWLIPVSADGETSRNVDVEALAAAQLTLLRDGEEAKRLGEAGRRRALQDFGIGKMVQSTLQVYRHAIANPKRHEASASHQA
jgi:glycosyltransferase involved in cell wall biosynthesis